jgi:hypothetical protein
VGTRAYIEVAPVHRNRYIRHEILGVPIEEIAKEDNVGLETVARSIEAVKIQKHYVGLDSLEASESEIVVNLKTMKQKAIERALDAERKVYVQTGPQAGEVLATEPDHEVQLKAVETITEITKAVLSRHAKGNSQTVNVGVGVGVSNSFTSFEDRLRDVKKRMGITENGLPPAVIDIAPEKAATDGNTP